MTKSLKSPIKFNIRSIIFKINCLLLHRIRVKRVVIYASENMCIVRVDGYVKRILRCIFIAVATVVVQRQSHLAFPGSIPGRADR
jgi:hypothetical protein